jgi:hypothetical protein
MLNTTRTHKKRPIAERFFEKTKTSETHSWNETPCLEWTAGRFEKGYGQFWFAGKTCQAHRVAMMLGGAEVGDLCVLHRCDNPPCVNREHLFLGTAADNVADKIAKGRASYSSGDAHYSRTRPECIARGEKHQRRMREVAARGEKHYLRTNPELVRRGESSSSAKLKESDIHDIREMAGRGVTQAVIAKLKGVSQGQVGFILRGERWAHIKLKQEDGIVAQLNDQAI